MTLHVHMDVCTLQMWGVQALSPDASLLASDMTLYACFCESVVGLLSAIFSVVIGSADLLPGLRQQIS